MPDRCDFRTDDIIDGKYRVTKKLGEGSFGKVYRVTDSKGSDYALKLMKLWEVHPEIRDQLVARFEMEYETGRIDSPYLVHSVNYGFTSGNPYIVMEFCKGGDLKGAPRNIDWNLVGQQVLMGLKALHACGKVHRDLKPENVLLKADGTAVLTDFGISGDRNKRMTERNIMGKPQQIFGTYAYMPPEQVVPGRGDATVLPTTDLFSFGVMMYELLTGNLPFGRLEDNDDLAMYVRNGKEGRWDRQTLLSTSYGKIYANVIEGCLEPNYKKRIQSADEALSMLPSDGIMKNPLAPDKMIEVPDHISGYLLRIMQGEDFGRTYDLTQLASRSCVLRMGRQSEDVMNHIPIREDQSCYVSRMHCTIEFDDGGQQWYIRDGQWDKGSLGGWRNSMNGTYVNSKEVTKDGLLLRIGDIISIGDTKLRIEAY